MSGDDIVKRLRSWDDGRISTHWAGCMDTHPVCAILFAADAIEARDAETKRLRDAANRTLNAFFCCEGLDNTHLMDAFSEWAVLMGHAAVPEAKAWIAKWEARREQ